MKKEEFIKKLPQSHLDKYIYDQVPYEFRTKDKILITCPTHGEFLQNASNHMRGAGCPACSGKQRTTKETFIQKAQNIHGDKYTYLNTEDISKTTDMIDIICPVHGKFSMKVDSHINAKQGCPKCGVEERTEKRKRTKEDFVSKAKNVHGGKYTYNNVVYKNSHTKVIITCPTHGDFEQLPYSHLNGNGCPSCAVEARSKLQFIGTEKFVEMAKAVHGDRYTYTNTNYTGTYEVTTITCPVHGDFEQRPNAHLSGGGCPKCGNIDSKGEKEIADVIESLGIDVVMRDRTVISPKELDIYIPSKNIAIEFNGSYWHSSLHKEKDYHIRKTDDCLEKGVQLIHIWDHEWKNKNQLMIKKIKNILGISDSAKVYARKTRVDMNIPVGESKEFLKENHIQGYNGGSIRIGLRHEGVLVACMIIKKKPDDSFYLSRYATSCNVVGGFSKLLSSFKKTTNWKEITTFSDLRFSNPNKNVYTVNGFEFEYRTSPNYFYLYGKNGDIYTRNQCMKHKLHKIVESFDPNESESENMMRNGFHKVYDCGNIKYKLTNEKYKAAGDQ